MIAGGRRAAFVYGALAFTAILLLGEGLAFLRAAGPLDPPALEVIQAGALVPSLVHRVPVAIEVAGPPGVGRLGVNLQIALTLATGLACWLLYLGGRRAADGTDRGWARVRVGVLVAVPYTLLSAAAALAARGADPAVLLGPRFAGLGRSAASPSVWWSVAVPLVLASTSGAAGALSRAPDPPDGPARVARGATAGGWRMAWLLLLGGTAGILTVAALHPDATRAFLDAAWARGPAGAAAVLLVTVLVLPNAGVAAGAAAMGVPVELRASGSTCTILSYGRLTEGASDCGPLDVDPLGLAYALFLVVPAAATLAGGWRAARRAGATTPARGALAGALAGAPFALLAGGLAFLATVSYQLEGSLADLLGGGTESLGPPLGLTLAIALAWGMAGGAAGGALSVRGP